MRFGRFLVGLLSVAVLFAGCTSGDDAETTTTRVPASTTTTTAPPLDLEAHAEGLLVGISSEGDFLTFDSQGILRTGVGSGLVVSTDGLILTSAGAVVGADRINVYLPGEEFPMVGELDAAAECVNLALVRIDHTFATSAALEDSGVPVAAASAVRNAVSVDDVNPATDGDFYSLQSAGGSGAVLFDEDGGVTGIVTAVDPRGNPLALRSDVAATWVRNMRQRDVVEQLGFTTAENTEGQLVVVSLAGDGPGSDLGLAVGDIVISTEGDEIIAGLDQLCDALADGQADLEVRKEGRRYIGAIPDQPLALASARSVDQIRQAVVEVNVPGGGTGSGFFISPDGLLVTNYHVAGSATDVSLQFDARDDFISGEVIGASACADLALIQAEPGDYQYLEWAPGPPALEEPVRVVGFPNATETISVQDGIVAKESTPTTWWVGSIGSFESSAIVDRGNSGGPVVNASGEVLGVTYAVQGGSNLGYEDSTFVFNSLHLVGAEARDVVAAIADGASRDLGFGPNNLFWRDLEGVTGYTIEVGEVRPGSAAAALGLELFDEIVVFGDVLPQSDPSGFRQLCDVVAANESRDPVDVVVWRFQDDTLWDGEFYGAPLMVRPDPYRLGTGDGSIAAIIPGRWIEHGDIDEETNDYVGYWAAPDLDEYFRVFNGVPGMRLMWSAEKPETHTTSEFLEGLRYADQAAGPIREFDDGRFVGHYQNYDFPNGVGVEYALRLKDDPGGPMIMLFLADDEHRVAATAAMIIESLGLSFPVSEE